MKKFLCAFAAYIALVGCGQMESGVSLKSLTGDGFSGQKYYFGWGAAGSGDPSMMHNEVKYDVLHTHQIFTEQFGGSYEGIKEIGTHVGGSLIRQHWRAMGAEMTANDMYVQYSSGHGYETGLAVGVSYDDIRDNALSYPAKEVVIFTMACKSGGLIDSFNQRRSAWANWQDQGRTLLVMGSSRTWENSSTGPGRDPEEENGPSGSAGSAFGHALWKALIGYSDGFVDGVKDGYISLDEIVQFVTWKTEQVGGHIPQITGTYTGDIIMNRVPPESFLASLDGSSEGLSDDEVMERIRALDRAYRF